MSKLSCLMLAAVLLGANAVAADSGAAAGTAAPATPGADLDAQLAAARQKLEAAARDVAQLSSQLGQSAIAQMKSLRTRAVLGLQLETQPSAKEQGAIITGVSPGGPAAEAGLAAGDVIVALNGEPTTGTNASRAVVDRMAAVKPDSKVIVKVVRDGKPKEFTVTARAGLAELFAPFDGHGPVWIARSNGEGADIDQRAGPGGGLGAFFEGMELADLSPALGQYFGTSKGVLVVRVPRDGEFLKLQDGDVILGIDGREPENASHATRILRSYQPGEKIGLKILRQKKPLELTGTLPEHRQFGRGPGPGPRPGPGGGPGHIPPAMGGPIFPDPPSPPQGRMVPLNDQASQVELARAPMR